MTTDANSLAAFYCPVHQVRFHATAAEVIECEQASHAIGYGFPTGSLWTYCCACATFAPHEVANLSSKLTECPVCERPIGKRCLCHSCQVLTVESVAVVHRKVHSIDDHGVKPFCPGCGSPPDERVLQHDCPELGITFLTGRPSCVFCELQIVASIAPQQNEARGISCNSCGAELVAPFRFCKKCGTAQLKTDTTELDEEFSDQNALSELVSGSIDESEDEPAAEAKPSYILPWDSPTPTPPKRRTPWLIGGAAALLSVAILIAVSVTNSNRTQPPAEPRIPDAPPGMVYMAGGDFIMGNNSGDEYERPAHKVTVAPFFIDVTEVTCEEYLKFLTATARRPPLNWSKQTCRNGDAKQPVTGVDWNEAKAYADWTNKRLPTEQEWEFAARGVLATTYPWGNEWRSNAANAGDSSAQRMMDVGLYPSGKTSAGVMDMIGNAVEWTSSDVVAYPGGSLSSPIPSDVKVVRGGSWRDRKEEATATYRGFLHTTNAKDYSVTGFRCVKDVGPWPIHSPKP